MAEVMPTKIHYLCHSCVWPYPHSQRCPGDQRTIEHGMWNWSHSFVLFVCVFFPIVFCDKFVKILHLFQQDSSSNSSCQPGDRALFTFSYNHCYGGIFGVKLFPRRLCYKSQRPPLNDNGITFKVVQSSFLDRVASSFKIRLQVFLWLKIPTPTDLWFQTSKICTERRILFYKPYSAKRCRILQFLSELYPVPILDHFESVVSMSICVQTEGSPAKDTHGCDLPRKSMGNSTSKSTDGITREPCRQAGEDIPRGMVVATTDLQMRSLTEEDEEEVGF